MDKVDRSTLFKQLIDPVKELLVLSHGSVEDVLYDTWNLLDNLLITYDKNAGNDEAIRKLSNSIFLNIPLEVDADLYFLTTIETFLMAIQKLKVYTSKDLISECRQNIESINPKTVEQLEMMIDTPVTINNNPVIFY